MGIKDNNGETATNKRIQLISPLLPGHILNVFLTY